MNDQDAAAFDLRLQEVMAAYGREMLPDLAMRAWWSALRPFGWPAVEAALVAHVAACKFAPTPADIVERLTANDGHLGPEAAWSLALQAQDEHATIVWTAEVAEAFGVAKPVLDAGDEVGARKAFLETYARALAAARARLAPASWSVSLGQDPQRRAEALLEAQRHGRLPAQTVARLLPPEAQRDAQALPGPAEVGGRLEGAVTPTPGADAHTRRRLRAAVHEGLRQGAAAKAAEHARIAERRRARSAELERQRQARRAELARRDPAASCDGSAV